MRVVLSGGGTGGIFTRLWPSPANAPRNFPAPNFCTLEASAGLKARLFRSKEFRLKRLRLPASVGSCHSIM